MRVWVNGTFDVLHIGHIRLLEFANTIGKVRVGLDTDDRIREKKGNGRPFNTLQDRMEFMSSIKFVDSVVSFSSDDELRSKIKEYGADVMVIGSDYKGKNIIGEEIFKNILYFERIPNKSTTEILENEDISNR